jgi:hypothetical protein
MRIGFRHKIIVGLYLLLLTLVSSRPYLYSLYDMDMMGYIGNAIAITGASTTQIHEAAYRAVAAEVPEMVKDHLLGRDMSGPPSQWKSRQDRAMNPDHFAEYLPCFAVRPIFNELVYLLHYKLGVGLIRATIVISVVSYWLTGLLVLIWLAHYVGVGRAALCSLLLMMAPPILNLARFNTPDALSCLVSLAALYLVFERDSLFWGLTLLLLTIYVRTDNVLLVIAVLGYSSLVSKHLEKTKAAVLGAVAVASVIVINHFAGDYGIRVLYYRSFVEVPLAPAEFVPQFGPTDYLRALRMAVSGTMNSYFLLFVLMGLVGAFARRHPVSRAILVVTTFYVATHFFLFPSGQERFWGPFYISTAMIMAIAAWYHEAPARPTSECMGSPGEVTVAVKI